MKKQDSKIANIVNPETKKIDLSGTLELVTRKLNDEPSIQRGTLFHRYTGSMHKLFTEYGIEKRSISDLEGVLQEVGLMMLIQRGNPTIWDVADADFIEGFLTEERISQALHNLKKHRKLVTEKRQLWESF